MKNLGALEIFIALSFAIALILIPAAASPQQNPISVYITTESAALYQVPTSKVSPLRTFPRGTQLPYLSEGKVKGTLWYQVQLPDGASAWISSEHCVKVVPTPTDENAVQPPPQTPPSEERSESTTEPVETPTPPKETKLSKKQVSLPRPNWAPRCSACTAPGNTRRSFRTFKPNRLRFSTFFWVTTDHGGRSGRRSSIPLEHLTLILNRNIRSTTPPFTSDPV